MDNKHNKNGEYITQSEWMDRYIKTLHASLTIPKKHFATEKLWRTRQQYIFETAWKKNQCELEYHQKVYRKKFFDLNFFRVNTARASGLIEWAENLNLDISITKEREWNPRKKHIRRWKKSIIREYLDIFLWSD